VHSLSQRVVFLTGAAGGIGACLARALAAQGALVALVDRNEEGLAAVAQACPGSTVHCADLVDLPRLPLLVHEVLAAHGQIDVVIHNAGLTVHGPFSALTLADLDRVLDVDLRAVVHLTHHLLPHLRLRDEGHLVLISSMSGLSAFPFQATYSAAKFGMRGLGDALRIELGPHGIGVSTVFPGTIATGFIGHNPSYDTATSERLAELMKRYGTPPERVASATVRAILRNRGRVRVGWDCHLTAALLWLCPPLLPAVLRMAHRRRLLGPT
jgi:short-subunit dehydrogenase